LELKVATVGKPNQKAVLTVLGTITKNVKQLSDVKTAEIATLFAAAKQEADTALASELAVLCENANLDYFDVIKLLEVDDPSFWLTPFGEENKNEAYLLLESAENLNVKLRLPTLARQINEDMVKHAVYLTQDALRKCSKTMRRARIAVLAKVNQSTALVDFVKMLELKGAKVSLYDPVSKRDASDLGVVRSSLSEAVEGADCVVVLSGEEQLKHLNLRKIKPLTKTPSVIVDLAGAFDRAKVESEGFNYSGFGRGTG